MYPVQIIMVLTAIIGIYFSVKAYKDYNRPPNAQIICVGNIKYLKYRREITPMISEQGDFYSCHANAEILPPEENQGGAFAD